MVGSGVAIEVLFFFIVTDDSSVCVATAAWTFSACCGLFGDASGAGYAPLASPITYTSKPTRIPSGSGYSIVGGSKANNKSMSTTMP